MVIAGKAQPASLGQEGKVKGSVALVSQIPQRWSLGGLCGEPNFGAVSGLSRMATEIGSAPPLTQFPLAPGPHPLPPAPAHQLPMASPLPAPGGTGPCSV